MAKTYKTINCDNWLCAAIHTDIVNGQNIQTLWNHKTIGLTDYVQQYTLTLAIYSRIPSGMLNMYITVYKPFITKTFGFSSICSSFAIPLTCHVYASVKMPSKITSIVCDKKVAQVITLLYSNVIKVQKHWEWPIHFVEDQYMAIAGGKRQ